jgi:hypothetical protein
MSRQWSEGKGDIGVSDGCCELQVREFKKICVVGCVDVSYSTRLKAFYSVQTPSVP